ncbi:MAG: hypothetical protein ACRDGM_18550, partial [bacterium]
MRTYDVARGVGLIRSAAIACALVFGWASFVLAEESPSQPAPSPTVQEEPATVAPPATQEGAPPATKAGEVQERGVSPFVPGQPRTPIGPVIVDPTPPGSRPDFDLAYYHAPIHYQDTDSTNYRADYVTRFNYDGNNMTATDNWENLNKFPLAAYAYYSVVETCTHWFIVYGFFHPRDWAQGFGQEHE